MNFSHATSEDSYSDSDTRLRAVEFLYCIWGSAIEV